MSFLHEDDQIRLPSRSLSRASSPSSTVPYVRPASSAHPQPDDNASTRQQVSVLQHTIRHQKAQLQHLGVLLGHSRPVPVGNQTTRLRNDGVLVQSDTRIDFSSYRRPYRSHSLDHLQSRVYSESTISDSRRASNLVVRDDIKEGIPASESKREGRPSSPTRTLSRIPIASVGNARALAEDRDIASSTSPSMLKPTILLSPQLSNTPLPLELPERTPVRRSSPSRISGGNTTKVLADLQAGVTNARAALENTRAQLRASQRTVAQLTRQNEDLKDGKERMRLENEGLRNVVARKERLLQEVLARARKAEETVEDLNKRLKSEISESRQTTRELEAQVKQSSTVSQKAEREYETLRASYRDLREAWERQMRSIKEVNRERDTRLREELQLVEGKYNILLEEIDKERDLRKLADRSMEEFRLTFQRQIDDLGTVLQRYTLDFNITSKMANDISNELNRLRGLIRAADRSQT